MNKYRIAAVLGGAVLGVLLVAPPAQADDDEPPPTARELLEKCDNGTDSCVFHPQGQPEYFQNTSKQVGSPVFNCTNLPQRMAVGWQDTTTETNSLELSMAARFGEIFKVTFKASYGHEWRSSHTEGQTTFVEAKPGDVGRVFFAPQMQKVKGTYELRFPDRFRGHYIWYVPMEATGPADQRGSAVTQSTKAMTPEEHAANCA